jgi:hypothetical protein
MGRKYIDCRECPSDINCTVALCADSENELLEAAVAARRFPRVRKFTFEIVSRRHCDLVLEPLTGAVGERQIIRICAYSQQRRGHDEDV